jgi:hypothetical protein
MSKVTMAVLAACLLGASLPACSLNDPSVKDFSQMSQRPEKAKETGNTIEVAEAACKAETQTKGIASITAIFSRFRKGSADEDYIACMKTRGFEVKQ